MPESTPSSPRRFAQIIRLKSAALPEYKRLHSAIWPEVASAIKTANIGDYSISYDEDSRTLFATFKYYGADFEGDMQRMAADPEVQRWWQVTDALQESLVPGAKGSKDGPWWKGLQEVFYLE
ncbi:MAG: hypothetical protein M1825_004091 [Sarcosagium campestre]|nr:MAG: hypothetical protein M1825_004091 [Sarcosagium campestre]